MCHYLVSRLGIFNLEQPNAKKGADPRSHLGSCQFIHFVFLICSSSVIDLADRSSHHTASGCDPRLIATCTYLGQTTTRLVRCSGHALHWRRRSSDGGEVASSTYDTTPHQGRRRPGLGSTDRIRLTFMDQQRTTKQGTQHSNIT